MPGFFLTACVIHSVKTDVIAHAEAQACTADLHRLSFAQRRDTIGSGNGGNGLLCHFNLGRGSSFILSVQVDANLLIAANFTSQLLCNRLWAELTAEIDCSGLLKY